MYKFTVNYFSYGFRKKYTLTNLKKNDHECTSKTTIVMVAAETVFSLDHKKAGP